MPVLPRRDPRVGGPCVCASDSSAGKGRPQGMVVDRRQVPRHGDTGSLLRNVPRTARKADRRAMPAPGNRFTCPTEGGFGSCPRQGVFEPCRVVPTARREGACGNGFLRSPLLHAGRDSLRIPTTGDLPSAGSAIGCDHLMVRAGRPPFSPPPWSSSSGTRGSTSSHRRRLRSGWNRLRNSRPAVYPFRRRRPPRSRFGIES